MLLRKVEELTLYVIEQNAELKAQNLKLKAESNQNEKLIEMMLDLKKQNENQAKEIQELKTKLNTQ